MNSKFNPEMLVLARESRGLTQEDLADALNVSQGEISKIETGLREPASELVKRFSNLLKYNVAFFALQDKIWGATSNCPYFRKRKSAGLQEIKRAIAVANTRRIQISRLLVSGAAELDTQNMFRRLDISEHPGGPANMARMVRAMWALPVGPITNLVTTVEDAGGIVFRCDFGSSKIDALSQWIQGLPPMFFLNKDIPCDRMRWTLAHEIGHIIMHQVPTENVETEANEFAAELLMPEREIKPYLTELKLPVLASLKPFWRVSMNALLKRASDLGTITERQKSSLWGQMGALGYRTHEPVPLPQEEPSLVREIISLHQEELGFSMSELADLMLISESEAHNEYLIEKSALRLVG